MFPAKFTWMPLGTVIFCQIAISIYGIVNYKDVR